MAEKLKNRSFYKRSKSEKKFVKALISRESTNKNEIDKMDWMVCDINWVQKYQSFLSKKPIDLTEDDRNGRIDNTNLIKNAQKGIINSEDFFLFTPKIYSFLQILYEGGPSLTKRNLIKIKDTSQNKHKGISEKFIVDIAKSSETNLYTAKSNLKELKIKTKSGIQTKYSKLLSNKCEIKPSISPNFEFVTNRSHIGDEPIDSMELSSSEEKSGNRNNNKSISSKNKEDPNKLSII